MAKTIADTIETFLRDELLDDDGPVAHDKSLFESMLLDSMSLTDLIGFLEETYSIKIDPLDVVLENFDSISKCSQFVAKKQSG